MRTLVIAGVTGSIGQQAIEVLPSVGDLDVVAVGAGSDMVGASAAAAQVGAAICTIEAEGEPSPGLIEQRCGPGAMVDAIRELKPDLVLNAVVGFAGVEVTRAAIEVGADIALANKESLVAGGSVVLDAAADAGVQIIPVDSEHAALAQLLEGSNPEEVDSVTLTASGGPFRGRPLDFLADVTVEEALNHPTWAMGGKISIDSATLMNKGLEVIEAERLFGLDYDQIRVVVHPQSIVHALVEYRDGVQTAHLGMPDMKAPIAWALAGRSRPALALERLDLAAVGSLTFEAPDLEVFKSLRLAYRAGRAGGGAPAVLNGANELAVESFLSGLIGFDKIADIVESALDQWVPTSFDSWSDVVAADHFGRSAVKDILTTQQESPSA